jgi:carbon-monoxide dehydrogenase large subunit
MNMPTDRGGRRREDARLVAGWGRFVDDLAPAAVAHVAFVRAVAAPARIVHVDGSAAAAMPGVLRVLTATDTERLGRAAVNALVPGLSAKPFALLARDMAEHAGQPVAAVIAETLAQALDAAEAVTVDLAPLDAAATRPAFALRHRVGDPDTAFSTGPVTRLAIRHATLAPMALEPRAALAETVDGVLVVHLSTQTPHRARSDLAAILRRDPASIRVIAPDVGGAFGGKASLTPEEAVTALAAVQTGRATRWTATRSEEFLAAPRGRGGAIDGAMVLAPDGIICAMSADIRMSLGAWMPFSAVVPARNAARILPGPYRVPSLDVSASGAAGTSAPVGIYRGAGRPEACLLMERLIDKAARERGLCPVAVRRANLIRPEEAGMTRAAGAFRDATDLPGLLERALEAAAGPGEGDAWARATAARDARRSVGEIVGLGVAVYVEPCGQGPESAVVTHLGGGRFRVATGSSAQGQGRETAYAAIAARALGVTPDAVEVVHGDTETCPSGIGALASRSTAIGGSAVMIACGRLVAAARAEASSIAKEVPPTRSPPQAGGGESGWRAVPGIDWSRAPRLEIAHTHTAEDEAWASGAVVVRVAIDRDTGAPRIEHVAWADDAGVVVDPALVSDQLIGGLAQGLGEALREAIVTDDSGQLLTGSLMDYAVPRAADMPPLALLSHSTPSIANPLGAKGVGEAGCIGVPAAILNAVVDALAPFGVTHLDMPLTSETIWRAMQPKE